MPQKPSSHRISKIMIRKTSWKTIFKMPWSVIDALEDPRDQLHFFLTFFNEAAKLHAPIMVRRVRANDVPWKSSEIMENISPCSI